MRRNEPIALHRLLNADAGGFLTPLVERAERLRRLEDSLTAFLGPPAGDHLRVANASGEKLVLHADSSVWSTRLRYLEPEIVEFARREGGIRDVRSVTVRVRPPRARHADPGPGPRLTPAAAGILRSVADAVDDPDLNRVLRRLSTRT